MELNARGAWMVKIPESTQFSTSIDDSYHDSSYVFTEEKGFQLAFGIVDVLNYKDDYREYLDIKVYQYSYKATKEVLEVDRTEIETYPCSDAELGLDNS